MGNGIASRDLTGIMAYDEETDTGYTYDSLVSKITDTMPKGAPQVCVGECAENTAAAILCDFNPSVTDDCDRADTDIVVSAAANVEAGQISYDVLCVDCHLADGTGTSPGRDLTDLMVYDYETDSGYTFRSLEAKIADTMPRGNEGACVGECATNTAALILCAFNPEISEGCSL